MSQASLSDITDGSAFGLSDIIAKSPLHGRDRTSNVSQNHASPRTALPPPQDERAVLQPLKETAAMLNCNQTHDSTVSLTSVTDATQDRWSRKNSVSKGRDKEEYPSTVEKIPTPSLSVKRRKRTSAPPIMTMPPTPDASTSAHEDDEELAPEVAPLPTGLDIPAPHYTLSTNPKVARVRSGRNMTVNIPVTVRLPNVDYPVTATGTIALPPPTFDSLSHRSTLLRPHTRSGSAPVDTQFAELVGDDLSRWTNIQSELYVRNIPLDALSPPQITELMRVSTSDPAGLPALLDKLAQIHQADAFEHVDLSNDDDAAAPKMYTYRYTHAAPLGEVYTYHPPSPDQPLKAEPRQVGPKSIGQLVKEGKEWGKRSHKARICRLSYAIIAGLGVVGAIVAVCYFRVGQGKRSFAHNT